MEQINDEITERLVKESFFIFLLEKWLISSGESRGDKYSFRERPHLLTIAQDTFPFQVVRKSAQCGVTELFAARAIHTVISERKNILYAFPAASQLKQLVGARIRPSVENNPYLFSKVTGALNLEQFNLNNNTVYFRGVQNRRQIITMDVSELYVDELDTAVLETSKNQAFGDILYTLEKRLNAAANPKKFYYSTPSYSGVGIDAQYTGDDTNPGSDMNEWIVKCRYCNKEQMLDWDLNIIDKNQHLSRSQDYVPNVFRVCSACKNEFSAADILGGRYVPQRPQLSSICHGYHISKLMNPSPNLNQMMLDSQNPMKEQEFRCSDLGIPFEPKGSKLTDDILELARQSSEHVSIYRTQDPTYFGTDVGKVLHTQVGVKTPDGKIKVLWAGELRSWAEHDDLIKRMNCRGGIIDAQPNGLEQKEFAAKYPYKVKLAYYPAYLETTKDICKDKDDMIIHINRTLTMSMVIQAFFNNMVLLPKDIRDIKDYYKMMKAPVKAQQEDVHGNMRTFFPPTRIIDHYYHAFVYLLVALESQPRDIIFIPRMLY